MNIFGQMLTLKQLNYVFTLDIQERLIHILTSLKNEDGSFRANPEGESDVRITYAAVASA